MKGIVKNTVIITLITLIAGVLLGLVYEITKDPIAKQNELAKQEACEMVFAGAESFDAVITGEDADIQAYITEAGYAAQTIDEVMEAKDASGNVLGYVLTVTSGEGYGGDIQFTMGVKEDGTVNGISFLSISETAGLGMKADTDEFKGQFADRNAASFSVTKTGASADNEIDAISGATITTNAVTKGVNAGLAAIEYLKGGNG
ncbi:MAG: RnfABCDGE type electron transport complex subunit G [Lachnospiraceae bacterium]|nr:RnfABCDGE type electron transport complex subunit G [Lachnospiraceae bacterium]